MKLKTQKKLRAVVWKSGVIIGCLTVLGLAYQNCGKAGFDSEDNGGSNEFASQNVDPKLAGLPFPYDISVNQIAFMTCPFPAGSAAAQSSSVIEGAGYFTWKVGAFDNNTSLFPTYNWGIQTAGLSLRPEFSDAFESVARKNNYNETFKPGKFTEALKTLPSVAEAQLQLSIRDETHKELTKIPGAGDATFPVKNFLAKISSEAIAGAFPYSSPTGTFNFFQAAANLQEASLEGTLTFAGSQYYYYSGGSLAGQFLTVGFSQPNSPNIAGINDRDFYAKGFDSSFDVAYSYPSNHPNRPVGNIYPAALSRLTEHDFSGAAPPQNWSCDYKLKIVRHADRERLIYRAYNFRLLPPTAENPAGCPGPVLEGDYCPTPDIYQTSETVLFGRPLSIFGTKCPARRIITTAQSTDPAGALHGKYCAEVYTQACPVESYAQRAAAFGGKGLAVYYSLRRFLPEDKWDINLSSACLVRKNDSGNACYGQGATVIYDEAFFPYQEPNWDADVNLGMYQNCSAAVNGTCPAYLTLCLKK